MTLEETIEKTNQILNEERANPTVGYEPNAKELHPTVAAAAALVSAMAVQQRPQSVEENPHYWVFSSINYNLLCALLSHVPKASRSIVFSAALQRMASASTCSRTNRAFRFSWNGLVSELPLVAEFCVRNNRSQDLFAALTEASPLPGHAVLLRHLEDMIARNFMVFQDAEYQQLANCVSAFQRTAARDQSNAPSGLKTLYPSGIGPIDLQVLFQEITTTTSLIEEKCRKARYLYLKASLLEGFNLEINQDKDAVQTYLDKLGFSKDLAGSLDEAGRLYSEGGSAFRLKASMGHIRSFLENLHKEAMPAIHAKFGGVLPAQWGAGLTYLRHNQILAESEEKFVTGLYTLISDAAVHPLVAEREYARLSRNVVIEYALLFLRKIDKLGLKPLR